jgi:chromosome segregation ATPase
VSARKQQGRKQQPVPDGTAPERELDRMRAELAETERTLVALERQSAELSDPPTNIRRAIGKLERNLARQRQALNRTELEAARRDYDERVAERDSIALRLADALPQILDDIVALDDARAAAFDARERLERLRPTRETRPLRPEPTKLADRWEELITRVRKELDDRLDDELLDAAARSPFGRAIRDLPTHLREAAGHRRRLLLKDARTRAGRA